MSLRNVISQSSAKEAMPMNAPEHCSKEVCICMFVDSDHAGDRVSCRSRIVFLIYVNSTQVQLLCMKQSIVKTSVFGNEFVTLKQGIDALRGSIFKLRMMGITISGPSRWRKYVSSKYNTQTRVSTQKEKYIGFL